jgi:hypothetical protein
MPDVPALTEISRALGEFDGAVKDVQAIRNRLATLLYRIEIEDLGRWLVPESHRPTCPLDGHACTSWTCLVDVCAEPEQSDSPSGTS